MLSGEVEENVLFGFKRRQYPSGDVLLVMGVVFDDLDSALEKSLRRLGNLISDLGGLPTLN